MQGAAAVTVIWGCAEPFAGVLLSEVFGGLLNGLMGSGLAHAGGGIFSKYLL